MERRLVVTVAGVSYYCEEQPFSCYLQLHLLSCWHDARIIIRPAVLFSPGETMMYDRQYAHETPRGCFGSLHLDQTIIRAFPWYKYLILDFLLH
jgi:hypothetical protein